MRWSGVLLAVLAPAVAWAQDPSREDDTDLFREDPADATHVKYGGSDEERAKELVRNGEVLSDQGHYASAILAWEDAFELSHDPLLLARIASAYEKMGAWDLALHSLEAYREVASKAEWAEIDARIGDLEKKVADAPVAEAPATPAPRASADEIAGVVAMDVPDKVFDDVLGRDRKVRPLPIALAGSGALALGVGAVFGGRSDAAHTSALGECVSSRAGLLCRAEVEPWLRRERSSALVADTAFAVGGAAVLAGVVTAVLHPRAKVAPVVTDEGGVGVAVELR